MTVKEIYGTDFPVILAPMAGITDLPFRILCKEQGADVMVTEMISAKALFYGNKNTLPLMQTEEEEKPIGPLHQNQKHEQQEPPYQPSLILQEWYKYAVSYSLPLGQSPPH